jgi:peroxiredoxin Q/BCP
MSVDAGAMAPPFTLETAQGPVSLADHAGHIVVLYFYPRDDTSGCTAEAIAFSAAATEFQAADATVIGVSRDSVASHRRFAAKHGLNVLLASDPEARTIAAYGAWVEKSMYGRTYMGIDRSTFLIGADGRIRRVWRKVKVPGHVDSVLEAVRTVGK